MYVKQKQVEYSSSGAFHPLMVVIKKDILKQTWKH